MAIAKPIAHQRERNSAVALRSGLAELQRRRGHRAAVLAEQRHVGGQGAGERQQCAELKHRGVNRPNPNPALRSGDA